MIGNDIVDLALAKKESNWKRTGFLDKIFTSKEQNLIFNAENPEIMVWNLWSRKEAAYKIYNRETGIRGYIPTQLECLYRNEFYGTVSCNGYIYYTKTKISKTKIHTIAVDKKQNLNKIKTINDTTEIYRREGIPFIIDTVTKKQKPVSTSHHGNFKAAVEIKN